MNYFLVAGEASGDLHTSRLMKELRSLDPSASFTFMGGPRMREVGGECVIASEHLAFMGFVDVAKNIGTIREAGKALQTALINTRPDVVICTDYASFCFQYVLPFVRKQLPQTKIVYFIPPKVWAWKKGRIKRLRTDTDLILSIFPFEIPFFQQQQLDQVKYIGNPTLEQVQQFLSSYEATDCPPYIALLPGSRRSEVNQNLPTMLQVANSFPDLHIKIAGTSSLPREVYTPLLEGVKEVELVFDDTYRVVKGARAALVTSGTATLETALLGTPQVVCYAQRAGYLANFIFKHLFTTPYISLVNLVADEPVVQELFGGLFKEDKIWNALAPLTMEGEKRSKMLEQYQEIKEKLQTAQPSSRLAAEAILELARAR